MKQTEASARTGEIARWSESVEAVLGANSRMHDKQGWWELCRLVGRRCALKVREAMTAPALTCVPQTSLAVAASLMRDADYGTLPVVDARGHLVGIITDRDICLAAAASKRSALNITVHEVMTHKVHVARLDDDVHSALSTMKGGRVRRLPVVDEAGHLEGILSIEDLVMRGLEGGGISLEELAAALRAMYVRTPAANSATLESEFTPG